MSSIFQSALNDRHSGQCRVKEKSGVTLTSQNCLSLFLPVTTWRSIIIALMSKNHHLRQQVNDSERQTVSMKSNQSPRIQFRKKQTNECKNCIKSCKHQKQKVKRYNELMKNKPNNQLCIYCHKKSWYADPVTMAMQIACIDARDFNC